MFHLMKKAVRKALNSIGLDIVRYRESPRGPILRLRSLPICLIIDVGRIQGGLPRWYRIFSPHAHIYSFEPLPAPLEELERWATRRNGQVTVLNVALGEHEGCVEMFGHLDHSVSFSLLETTGLTEELYPLTKRQATTMVRLTTLDRAMADMSLAPNVLIKLRCPVDHSQLRGFNGIATA